MTMLRRGAGDLDGLRFRAVTQSRSFAAMVLLLPSFPLLDGERVEGVVLHVCSASVWLLSTHTIISLSHTLPLITGSTGRFAAISNLADNLGDDPWAMAQVSGWLAEGRSSSNALGMVVIRIVTRLDSSHRVTGGCERAEEALSTCDTARGEKTFLLYLTFLSLCTFVFAPPLADLCDMPLRLQAYSSERSKSQGSKAMTSLLTGVVVIVMGRKDKLLKIKLSLSTAPCMRSASPSILNPSWAMADLLACCFDTDRAFVSAACSSLVDKHMILSHRLKTNSRPQYAVLRRTLLASKQRCRRELP